MTERLSTDSCLSFYVFLWAPSESYHIWDLQVGKKMGFPDTVIVTSQIQHSNTDNAESSAIFQQLHRDGMGFPGGRVVKNLPANAGDMGSIPGLGRCTRGGIGNPLQYSCWKISTDRGAWKASVHEVTGLDTTEQLSTQSQYTFPQKGGCTSPILHRCWGVLSLCRLFSRV